MNKEKELKKKTEENMQVILGVLLKHKLGLYATNLAELTGFSLRQCARMLSMLREQGKVNQIGERREWVIAPKQEPIYPNLDADHEKWSDQVRTKKVKYNPWGQGNATN